MNGAVAGVLNKVLGDWIENLDSENLNLSVFSGEILLQDLSLKPEAFNNLGLPFQLVRGYVGKISAKIPWTSLGSSPLKILIENIQVFLAPIPAEQWKEDYEISRYISKKLSTIKRLEAMSGAETEIENKPPGFVEKLVGKIVDNLQIEIKSVYVRYSDAVSSTSNFSLGLAIDSLKAVTCNSDWGEEFVEGSSVMYKLVQVSNLRLFLDYAGDSPKSHREIAQEEFTSEVQHSFIIPKTSLRLEAVVNKKSNDFSMPQIRLDFSTTNLQFNLDTIQLKHVIKALNFFNYFEKFQKGVLATIVEEGFNKEEADTYRALVIQTKTPIKSASKALQIQEQIEGFEKAKGLEAVNQQRTLARKEFELLKIEAATRQEIETASAGPSGLARVSGFFSRKTQGNEEAKLEKIEKLKQQLNKINEERSQLFAEVQDLISDTEVFTEFPPDFLRFLFIFKIHKFSLKICEGPTELLLYMINYPSVEIALCPSSYKIQAGISSSSLLDLQESQHFPNILESGSYSISITNKPSLSISMNSGELKFVLKITSLMKTVAALKEPLVKDLDYSHYTKAATDKTKEYISKGEEYIAEVMSSGIKTSVSLDIHLKAPVIIVPLTPQDPSKGVLVIDLGSIDITTASKNIEENLYDQYTFHLANFHCLTCWENPLLQRSENFSQILLPVTLDIMLYNSLTNNIEVPSFMLDVILAKFAVTLEDRALELLIRLKDMLADEVSVPDKSPDMSPDLYRQETVIKVRLIMKFKIAINYVCLTLVNQSESFLNAEINDFLVETIIKGSDSVDCSFHLGFVEVKDCRPGVLLQKIICNPLLQPFDDEFSDALEELKQISGKITYDGKTKVNVLMSDLRIVLCHEVAARLLQFISILSLTPSETKKKQEIAQEKNSNLDLDVEVVLSNIIVLLPLDTSNLAKRVGSFKVSISLNYVVHKSYSEGIAINYHEALHIQFNSIIALIGIFGNNTVRNTIQKQLNLLDPTQFSVSYSKALQNGEVLAGATLELDKIHIELGFRDLDFANTLLNCWKIIQIPESSSNKPPAPVTPLKLELHSREIEARLSDDTIPSPVPLIFFCISQLQVSIALRPTEKVISLCSRVYANCYILNKNAVTTEALIEEWEFTVGLNTREEEVPFNLKICSEQMLNINVSANMIKTLGKISKKFTQNPEFWMNEVCDDSSNQYVWVINELGEDLVVNMPDEPGVILQKKQKIRVKNCGEAKGKFNSHIIIQADESDQVYLEIESNSKEFTIKRGNNYISCLLRLQENTEEPTFILQTETELYNFTDKPVEVSSKSEKFVLVAGQKLTIPLNWEIKDLKVLTDSGPALFANSFILGNTFVSIEKLTVKDSLNYLHLLYIFLPTFFIQNLLPCTLSLYHQPITAIRLGMQPGETKGLGINPKALGRVQFSLALNSPVISSWCDLGPSICKISIPENANKMTLESSDYDVSSLLPEFTLVSKNINCKLLQVYARYIVINKTSLNLELKPNLVVMGNSLSLIRANKDKIKFRAVIAGKTTAWCKNINTKTLGISGCVSLDNSKNPAPQEITLGIQILNPPLPMIKSKLICICPRYLISNSTSRDLFIRQLINGKPGNTVTKVTNEHKEYYLENSFDSKTVQISTNTKHWSFGFNIDEITEFQVCLDSLNSEIAENGPWYLPSGSNDNKTFVLSSVYSEDNCTIHINFRNPDFPAFLIVNYTEAPLT